MKNIFVDCYVFEGEFQGTRTFIKEVYSKLFYLESLKEPSLRNRYYLVCFEPEALKKEFINFDFLIFIKPRFKNRIIRLLFEYPIIILKNKINLAHFQYIVPPIKFCKYVNTIHDILFCDNIGFFPWKYRVKNFFLFYFSYLLSDIVTTVSLNSFESIQRNFPFKKIISLTPNGVNEKYYNYISSYTLKDFLSSNRLRDYILYVSRFEPRKNHINLLMAYVKGGHFKKYDLVFIGSKTLECSDFYEYFNSVDEEIKSHIRIIHDGVSNALLMDFYFHCSSFIYPSLLEGFGIPPLEASAMGKHVICSNTTAMEDFSFYSETHVYPSVENLSYQIAAINSQENNLLEIKNIISDKYNWHNTAVIFMDLFNKNNK
jgi:glycosyltransferase involved in cell wall biosynthesis